MLKKFSMGWRLSVAATAVLMSASVSRGQLTVDPELPEYTPVSGIAGSIKSVGSDTMNNLMTNWGEGFRKYYPNVRIEIEGKGSSTAPPALISGTSTFGPMSRRMKPSEVDKFEARFGYKPVQLPTSIDTLAVFVHKDNPIEGLSLPELDAIFSSTRKMGHDEDITTWGQVGLEGEWANKPVSLYGRNAASGTYGFFKSNVLGKGDYKDSVKEQGGSAAVVQAVANDAAAIGYSGIGYATADVRPLPLALEEGGEFIPPEGKYAYTGQYPLARFLFLSVNYKPGTELDPLRREFLKYIFSREGQEIVIKNNYYPVTRAVAEDALALVDVELDD